MDKDTEITKVIFRFWYVSKDVIALFPEIIADQAHHYCESFEHIGQHDAANYQGIIEQSRPATPEEYEYLKQELESYPYGYNLKVLQRRPNRRH